MVKKQIKFEKMLEEIVRIKKTMAVKFERKCQKSS